MTSFCVFNGSHGMLEHVEGKGLGVLRILLHFCFCHSDWVTHPVEGLQSIIEISSS
jgi:hypothetical protein